MNMNEAIGIIGDSAASLFCGGNISLNQSLGHSNFKQLGKAHFAVFYFFRGLILIAKAHGSLFCVCLENWIFVLTLFRDSGVRA